MAFPSLRLRNIFGPMQQNFGQLPDMVGNSTPDLQYGTNIPPNFPINKIPFGDMNNDSEWDMPAVKSPMNSSMQQPSGSPNDDIFSLMSQLYSPEHTASDRFNSILDSAPTRRDPGTVRKIGAALAGFGGMSPQDIDASLYAPYHREMADWKTKLAPAQQGAQLERQNNINERTMAYQTISAKLKQEADEHKAKLDDTKAAIAQQRANVYQMKSLQPDLKFNFTGPKVLVTNPKTGEVKATDIDTGNLTDADKMALSQEQALERIGATGNEARETEGVRQENRATNIVSQGEQNRLTRATPSGAVGGVNKPELPTQTRARQFSKAQQAYNSHPEWRSSIKLGTNDFKITATDPNTISQINSFIYGSPETDRRATSPNNVSKPNELMTRTVKNRNTGEVKQQTSNDGGKTWSFK